MAFIGTSSGAPLSPRRPEYRQAVRELVAEGAALERGARITQESHPDLTEREWAEAVASESENPNEVLSAIAFTRAEQAAEAAVPVDTRGEMIRELAEDKGFSRQSFDDFGDPNVRTSSQAINRRFLRAEGLALDAAARQVTENSGIATEPQDIVDWIVRESEARADPLESNLRARFEDLTGIHLTETLYRELEADALERQARLGEAGPVRPAVEAEAGAEAGQAAAPARETTPFAEGEVRATRAEIDAARARMGFEGLSPAQRQGWERSMEIALREGYDRRAEALAARAEAGGPGSILLAEERMGVLLALTASELRLRARLEEAAEAARSGQAERADVARRDYDEELSRMKRLEEALVKSGTLTARALQQTQAGVAADPYSLSQIELRAQVAHRAEVPRAARGRLQALSAELEAQRAEVARLEASFEARLAERLEQQAQAVLTRMSRRRASVETARERRQAIKERLAQLGLEVTVGLNPEQALLVARLIGTYVEEGTHRLPEVIARTRSELPTLEARDVVDVLAGRFAEGRTRSEKGRQLSELRQEARLVARIEDLVGSLAGAEAPTRQAAMPTETVTALREALAELQERILRPDRDRRRAADLTARLMAAREALASGEARQKRSPRADPPEIAQVKAELAEVRRLHDLEDQIRDLEEQLSTGEFKVESPRARREASEPLRRARARQRALEHEVDASIAALSPLTTTQRVLALAELPRNVLASGDIGALGRQGIFHTLNPFKWRTTQRAARSMLAALREMQAHEIQDALQSAPQHGRRVRAGLAIKDLSDTRYRDRETVVRNALIERAVLRRRLAGKADSKVLNALAAYMRASENNMVVALNVLRAELFDSFAARHPQATDEDLARWAHYVNVTTGHGEALGAAGDILNRFFFSPRLLTSRILTPFVAARLALRSKTFAREVGKDFAGLLTGAGAVLMLASLAGADVELDPEESDFLKVQTGPARFDVLGGYSQALRLFLRSGLSVPEVRALVGKDAAGRAFGEPDFYGLWGTYLQYKLAPALTAAVQIATGEDFLGRPTPRAELIARSMTPIVLQEAAEGFRAGGATAALGALLLSEIGVAVTVIDDPLRHQNVEWVIRQAGGAAPQAAYPAGATEGERAALRRQFRAALAEQISASEDLYRGLTEEDTRRLLAQQAAAARKQVSQ